MLAVQLVSAGGFGAGVRDGQPIGQRGGLFGDSHGFDFLTCPID